MMMYVSYHNNNHFNSVRPPISSQPNGPAYLSAAEQLKEDMQHAIYKHQDEFGQAITMASTENIPMFPKEKINSIRENSQKIMSYIACQLSTTDGQCIFAAQLEQDRDQAEEHALGQVQHDAELAPTPQDDPTPPSTVPLLQLMVAQYEAELQKAISSHGESVLLMLKEFPSHNENSTILPSRYKELHGANFPIMTSLANLIMHLGGKEIPHACLAILANQAEEEALLLYSSSTTRPSTAIAEDKSPSILSDNADPLLPPIKQKASLKPSKFFPVFAGQTSPHQTDIPNGNDSDEEDEPGVYSKLDEGVGDGTHYITASFVKSNNKIKDQLQTQVR
jgi:hypothetical protein